MNVQQQSAKVVPLDCSCPLFGSSYTCSFTDENLKQAKQFLFALQLWFMLTVSSCIKYVKQKRIKYVVRTGFEAIKFVFRNCRMSFIQFKICPCNQTISCHVGYCQRVWEIREKVGIPRRTIMLQKLSRSFSCSTDSFTKLYLKLKFSRKAFFSDNIGK